MNLICRIAPLALAVAPCVLPPAVYAQDAAASKPNRIVNRVAATVNGRPVTSSEVRARLAPYIRELMMLYPRQGPRFSAELIKAKKAVMQELIERELVLSEFETKGYQMPESVIDEEISRRVLMQFNGDRDALLDNLRKSGMTREDIDFLDILHIKRSGHLGMLKDLGLTEDQTIYLENYGHIGQIDQILSLKLALEQGKVKDGDVAVMIAAGIGYTWAANVIQWGEC